MRSQRVTSAPALAAAKAAAQTWVQALAASFKNSPASAVTLAVMALTDPETKAADPQRYAKYTDTAALGQAVAAVVTGAHVANGTYLDLTDISTDPETT